MSVELKRVNDSEELQSIGRSVDNIPVLRSRLTGNREEDLKLLREVEDHEAAYEATRLLPLLEQDNLNLPNYKLEMVKHSEQYTYHQLGWTMNQLGDLTGKNVCDFCSGPGEYSVYLALKGAKVWGFDICSEAILLGDRLAKFYSVDDRVTLAEGSAYSTGYADHMFDFVFAYGALHHLHLPLALEEIKRILKPTGKLVFAEPLADNSSMSFLKNKVFGTSAILTQFEQPLGAGDIQLIRSGFSDATLKYFRFFARFERRMKSSTEALRLYQVDDSLMRVIPSLRNFASAIAGSCNL